MNKLIYISSSWCGPCRTLSPIMSKVAESGIPVQKMDADKDQETVMRYGVRNIPTVIKVDGNGNTISQFSGIKTLEEIINFYKN